MHSQYWAKRDKDITAAEAEPYPLPEAIFSATPRKTLKCDGGGLLLHDGI
jgi:hypothetical protein